MAAKAKLTTSILAQRHAIRSKGSRLCYDPGLLRRTACRRSAPEMLAFGGNGPGRPAGLAMAGHSCAPEMYEMQQRRLGRSATELGRSHRLQQGREWITALQRMSTNPNNATCNAATKNNAVRKDSFCVLCRQYCCPAMAPAEPPTNATSNSVDSGTRRIRSCHRCLSSMKRTKAAALTMTNAAAMQNTSSMRRPYQE